MKKRGWFLFCATLATPVWAGDIPPRCIEKVRAEVIQRETEFLQARGETLASPFEASVYNRIRTQGDEVHLVVVLEDPADGRWVRYELRTHSAALAECKVAPSRMSKSACRYSRDTGPEALNQIKGLSFLAAEDLKPDAKLTSLQESQIRIFLEDSASASASIREWIKQTDDQRLSTGKVTLPSGIRLTYYGAYGGENSFGIFFLEGTLHVAGKNSDAFVCLQ